MRLLFGAALMMLLNPILLASALNQQNLVAAEQLGPKAQYETELETSSALGQQSSPRYYHPKTSTIKQ